MVVVAGGCMRPSGFLVCHIMDPKTDQLTTMHVQRAIQGDGESLTWIVNRFTPVLLAQARCRLGERLSRVCDPEDLVNDVWTVAFPRLASLPPRGGRFTPVVMKFLSTTLLNRLNNLVKQHIRNRKRKTLTDGEDAVEPLDRFPADSPDVEVRLSRSEDQQAVLEAIETLDEEDRLLVILRGIEQNSGRAVAAMLSMSESAVSIRYHQVLRTLRTRLKDSIFDDFPEG